MSSEERRPDDNRSDTRSGPSGGSSGGSGGGRSGPSDSRGGGYRRGGGTRPYFRKKVCRFCTQDLKVSYRSPDSLRRFVTERGKILPRRITGNCAKHQRVLATQIKRARVIALLPYSKT